MTLDAELKEVATMASVALALLGFFTNMRADRWKKDIGKGISKEWSKDRVLQFMFDLGLAVITLAACAAMWSLFRHAVSFDHWADRRHALRSLFAIIYVGFVLLLTYQLALALRRARKVRWPRLATSRDRPHKA